MRDVFAVWNASLVLPGTRTSGFATCWNMISIFWWPSTVTFCVYDAFVLHMHERKRKDFVASSRSSPFIRATVS